ncbi:phosphatidylinositol-binding protein scs2 [Diaporthe australafricana]|uniref:Phosphatidylinositol-binding protein scs2 n=1 Tax=Diaporthe australafricana TaxID=127596 RepID=A0ABR3WMM4_9PEZI
MSVEIDPQELGFRRPFTVEVSQLLKLKNPNKAPVAFKVKTTAPKQYCVRPNSGRIEPGHEVEVTVLLQAMKQDPPADTKCRDKFLVQSVPISGDLEFSNVQTIWESVEKSQVQERKIRVIFLPAAGASSAGGVAATPIRQQHFTNGAEQTPDNAPPPSYSSPEEHRPASSNAPPSEGVSEYKDDPDVTAPIAASPQAPNDITKEEGKRELASSEGNVAASREQEGLRQRKGPAAAADVPKVAQIATAARPQGTEGVPIQIVAGLCLVSFLLAYFFF